MNPPPSKTRCSLRWTKYASAWAYVLTTSLQDRYHFGSAYGTFAHWFLSNGNGSVLGIKGFPWGGVVSGLG